MLCQHQSKSEEFKIVHNNLSLTFLPMQNSLVQLNLYCNAFQFMEPVLIYLELQFSKLSRRVRGTLWMVFNLHSSSQNHNPYAESNWPKLCDQCWNGS